MGYRRRPMDPSPSSPTRIVAAIVVGAGSARLLVTRTDGVTSAAIARSSATIGLGLDADDPPLSEQDAVQQAEEAVLVMAREARAIGAERMVLACTDVARDASTEGRLLQVLERATGIRPRILSASEQASLAFRGLMSEDLPDSVVVADLGRRTLTLMGGTGELAWATTTDVGTDVMMARYDPADPPLLDVLGPMMAFARETLSPVAVAHPAEAVVVTGGSAIAVATLADDDRLTRDRLVTVVERLAGHASQDIAADTGLERFRVRGCLAAAAILEATRKEYDVEALLVSEVGLREGLILESFV